MTRYAIGVDVGGTSIKSGLVDDAGRILASRRLPTHSIGNRTVLEAIIEAAQSIRREAAGIDLVGVGFGMPEFVQGPDWVQLQATNVPSLEGVSIRPALAAAFGSSIACDNDNVAAAMAEWHFGGHAGAGRLLYLGIGTGISCGVIDAGKPLRYGFGASGDTGHIIVDAIGATPCACGGKGCLEAIAAGPAIASMGLRAATSGDSTDLEVTLRKTGGVTASDVADSAGRGDGAAIEILERAGWSVGIALTSLIHMFGPNTIVIGGGVATAGDLLLGGIQRAVHQYTNPFYLSRLTGIQGSALGDESGILGAAGLVLFES